MLGADLTGDKMTQRKKERFSRRRFLKTVGAGTAGAALVGAPAVLSGCDKRKVDNEHRSERGGPNVILIIIDTLRKDHVGAYGNDWIKTPNLDALAKESLLFTRAHPEAMPTIPARRAIHTGMRTWPAPSPHFGWAPIPPEQRTLAEILSEEGYATFLVTDTYVQFPMNFKRGFGVYYTIRGQENDHFMDASSVSDEE